LATELPMSCEPGRLSVSDEMRVQIGLAPDEFLRLLHSGDRTLLLERTSQSSNLAVPWDRDLVLSADVRSFPLADVLSMLHRTGKSGFLAFMQGSHEKSVYLHRGEVVFATSNQDVDRLGECLFRAEVITLEQLRDAQARWTPTSRTGKVLVERSILTPRELWNGVKLQVEEIVRSLFAYTIGMVHFWEGEVQPDNVVRLALPTRRLISEGLQRRDELLKLLAALEDPRVHLEAVPEHANDLSGNARSFVDALGRDPHFKPACRRAGLDPLSGAKTVQLLRLVGALRVVRGPVDGGHEDSPETGQNAEVAVRISVQSHVMLLAELVAPLVAADGAAAVHARMKSVLEDLAQRYPKLLEDVEPGPAGTLDPRELEERALRLTGDRQQIVHAALGELVTYLEFELQNHPQIDDPEEYLDALEGLRAKIDR
jgi:hypothetical protein